VDFYARGNALSRLSSAPRRWWRCKNRATPISAG